MLHRIIERQGCLTERREVCCGSVLLYALAGGTQHRPEGTHGRVVTGGGAEFYYTVS